LVKNKEYLTVKFAGGTVKLFEDETISMMKQQLNGTEMYVIRSGKAKIVFEITHKYPSFVIPFIVHWKLFKWRKYRSTLMWWICL